MKDFTYKLKITSPEKIKECLENYSYEVIEELDFSDFMIKELNSEILENEYYDCHEKIELLEKLNHIVNSNKEIKSILNRLKNQLIETKYKGKKI